MPSAALQHAMQQVKDFMTDSQKALILLREGKSFFDAGDVRGALDCFNEGISYNPNVTLFNQRAACHKALEMFSEAYFDYSFNIRIEPDIGQHYCNRALCSARMKKLGLALEDMALAILYDPSSAHYYARATIYGDFGRFEEALADYTSALNEEGGNLSEFRMKCLYRRALTCFDMAKYDDVVKDAREVLMLDANNIPVRALLGRTFKQLSEYQQAEEQLNHAIALDPHQASLYTERGDIRFRTGLRNKIIEAVYDFDKAVKILESKNAAHSSNDNGNMHNRLVRSSSTAFVRSTTAFSSDTFHHQPMLERRDSSASIRSSSSTPHLQKSHSVLPKQETLPPSVQKKEIEEQLGDTLYKRAQAKLMIEADPMHLESALSDVMKAISYFSEDDDYYLVAAACYIRLMRYTDASNILKAVLERSPENSKALYNLAFCRRAEGSQKDAIADLTKIISQGNYGAENFHARTTNVSIHRVYEMRGTLLHEVQAHQLSLMDLGKAIAINPSQPANYFLRGDCHLKLGNYEQALTDFNSAELKGFQDHCSLCLSRGMVKRLLKDYQGAINDFEIAYDHLDVSDRIGKIRVLSFHAFCLIDLEYYNEALKTFQQAHAVNDLLIAEKMKLIADRQVVDSSSSNIRDDLLYCKRTEWILNYHIGLCFYMLKAFRDAKKLIEECLDEAMQKFIPDDLSSGCLYFFLGETQLFSEQFNGALISFQQCLDSHWADTAWNRFITTFAMAKALQCSHQHKDSIEWFSKALDLRKDNPYCYFRRAWSFKALGDYVKAGDDFETAKQLKPNDPNFAIDYKRISKFEYMEIATEPDIVERFPPLLPHLGLQSRV